MRRALALCALVAGCAPAPSGEIVVMRAETHVAAPPAAVFALAADPLHEAGLRREALRFEADGPLAPGTTYTETIDLGLVNGYTMRVRVAALEPGRRVRMAAPPGSPRRFAAERLFRPEGSGTRLVYTVEAEDRVVRDIARLPVPLWLAREVYEADMRAYLRRLRDRFAG